MTQPKRRLRGLPDLGAAIDERIKQRSAELELRGDTGIAPLAPLEGGGTIGGDGDPTDTPAFPESFVQSLAVEGGTAREGHIELQAKGTLSLSEAAGMPAPPDWAFAFTGKSMLSVASLPATGDIETLYRRTSDDTLWWDRSGAGDWLPLGGGYWQRSGSELSPATANDTVVIACSSGSADVLDVSSAVAGQRTARFINTNAGNVEPVQNIVNDGPGPAQYIAGSAYLRMDQRSSDPAAPSGGLWHYYFKSDGMYVQSGSSVIGPLGTGGGGSASASEVEVDCGSALYQSSFDIEVTDAAVSSGSVILLTVSGNDPTGRSADEVNAQPLWLTARPGSGQFDLHIETQGSFSGNLKINYLVA